MSCQLRKFHCPRVVLREFSNRDVSQVMEPDRFRQPCPTRTLHSGGERITQHTFSETTVLTLFFRVAEQPAIRAMRQGLHGIRNNALGFFCQRHVTSANDATTRIFCLREVNVRLVDV